MAERKEVQDCKSLDLIQILHNMSVDEGLAFITECRDTAIQANCHRIQFEIVGEYDYTGLVITGYRYETDAELSRRVGTEDQKRQRKIEKKRAQLEKIQAELQELETDDD